MLVFQRLRDIGPLVVVMILAVTGYANRFELQGVVQHVLGALMPYRGEQVGEGSVSFAALGPTGSLGSTRWPTARR